MTTSSKRRTDKPVIVTPAELKQQIEKNVDRPKEGLLKLTAQQFAQSHLEQWDRGGWLQWVKLRSKLAANARLTLPEWLDVFDQYSISPAGGGEGA